MFGKRVQKNLKKRTEKPSEDVTSGGAPAAAASTLPLSELASEDLDQITACLGSSVPSSASDGGAHGAEPEDDFEVLNAAAAAQEHEKRRKVTGKAPLLMVGIIAQTGDIAYDGMLVACRD